MRMVLLPGLDGTGDLFAPFLAALPPAHHAQIIRYPPDKILSRSELLQHIRQQLSIPDNGAGSLHQFPQTQTRMVAEPGSGEQFQPTNRTNTADEPYILLAESFSGPVAIELAATNPPNLRALILVATFATPPHRPPLQALLKFCAPILTRITPPAFIIRALMTGPNAPAPLIAQIQNSLRQVRPDILASRFKMIHSTSQLENLRSLRLPILMLTAESDRLISPHATKRLIGANLSATNRNLPASHLLLQTQPALAIDYIDDFLRSASPRLKQAR